MCKINQAKKSKVIFRINKFEFIEIKIPNTINNVYSFDYVQIFYHKNDIKYLLFTNDFLIEALGSFQLGLEYVLENKLQLHESIKNDIGYLWNECLWNKKNKKLIYESNKNWVGEKYLLLSTPVDNPETWIYQKDETIYLEVTPFYEWKQNVTEKENKILYKNFLKNYKPYVVTKIDKKTAIKWLKKVNKFIDIIRANDKKCIN